MLQASAKYPALAFEMVGSECGCQFSFRMCVEGGAVVSEESGEYGEFHGDPWSDEEEDDDDDNDDDDGTSPAADPSTMTEEEVCKANRDKRERMNTLRLAQRDVMDANPSSPRAAAAESDPMVEAAPLPPAGLRTKIVVNGEPIEATYMY
jgi:hypothetical protein